MTLPRLALTPGEPAGVGPELLVKLAQTAHAAELIVVGDPWLLTDRAHQIGLPLTLIDYDPRALPEPQRPGCLRLLPIPLAVASQCGQPDVANAHSVLQTLERSAQGCLSGEFAAMVTGPVHKGVIADAGYPFTGHTEFLAQLTGGTPVMMLTAPGLRVALVTTHLPLRAVADAITAEHLTKTLRTLVHDLQTKYRLSRPRILVLGLNPHAGEGGHMGTEDRDIIQPVITALRAEGFDLTDPMPADTAFTPHRLTQVDAVLAMYHDQGLPVLKYLGFGQAINVTLGLPIIRTSVDHGTAFDLAGTGRADVGSLEAAVNEAIRMVSTS